MTAVAESSSADRIRRFWLRTTRPGSGWTSRSRSPGCSSASKPRTASSSDMYPGSVAGWRSSWKTRARGQENAKTATTGGKKRSSCLGKAANGCWTTRAVRAESISHFGVRTAWTRVDHGCQRYSAAAQKASSIRDCGIENL